MAKTVKEIMNEISELNVRIKQIICHADFENYDDLSGLDIDRSDADQLFLSDELYNILDKLSDVSHTLSYLEKPIKTEGVLHKNKYGRYEVNGVELSSGCKLEYLATDDYHMRYNENDDYVITPYWNSSRMEHNGIDYYIVDADKDTVLEGLRVRIR